MFPCLGVGPGVERGGACPPGEVRWARDERVWVCELGLWRAGGGPAASGCACVCVARVSVCVSGGGSRPASPLGARVPRRVRLGRGPASGTPERRGPPASRPGLGASQVRSARQGLTPRTREAVREAGIGRRGLGPRFPRPGPRQEARRPAARPNRLRARLPARSLAGSLSRPPAGLSRRSRDSVLARALGAAPGLAR